MFPSLALDQLLTEMNVLPVELKRNLVLMRTLSEELTEVSHRVDKYADYYFSPNCLVRERSKTIAKANRLMTGVNDFGDDKVQLAVQTYEMVDKYIRKLDSNLVRLESARQDKIHVGISRKELIRAIIKGKQLSMANGIKTTDLDHINTALANTSINDHKPILMNTLNPVYRGSVKVRSEKSNQLLDMPVDPNEPRFCSCQQVSFGQMIGCDNTDCPTEWFHFSCVKLNQTPKGKWFCPQCKTKKNTITKKIS